MWSRMTLREKLQVIVLVLAVFFAFVAYGFMLSDGSICDTPLGARDMRCMGHFNR